MKEQSTGPSSSETALNTGDLLITRENAFLDKRRHCRVLTLEFFLAKQASHAE